MTDLGYDVVGLGERETAAGLDLYDEILGKTAFSVTSAAFTERGGEAPFVQPYVVKEYDLEGKGKIRVGFISLTSYNSLLVRTGSDGRAIVSRDPADQARRYVPEVAGKADFVVLLANLSMKDLERVGQAVPGQIDLALATFGDRFSVPPNALESFAGIPTYYAGGQGKGLGEVRIFLDGGKVREMAVNLVMLGKRYPEDPKMQRLTGGAQAKVNESMKQAAPVAMPPAPRRGTAEPPAPPAGVAVAGKFVGSERCTTCHGKEYRVWEGSAHARAMTALVKANQDFNPECVRCHVTGFGTSEGFQSASTTPQLANVQCEACHGVAALHMADVNKPYGRISPRVCYGCHTKERSPDFSFFKYWEMIKH